MGWKRTDLAPGIDDAAGAWSQIAHGGENCRRLAGAVASEQADNLARPHDERDTLQHMAIAVIGMYVLELEHQCAAPR